VGWGKTKMDPKKLMAVANYTVPQNTIDMWAFLGFTGYYQYFVPRYLQVM
jgi:predicted metalloprotease with PDZ domain